MTSGYTVNLMPPQRLSYFESGIVAIALLHGTRIFDSILGFNLMGSPLATYLWLIIYTWVIVALFRQYGFQWLSWLLRYRLLLVIVVVWICISFAWSVNPNLSLQRAIHFTGATLVGYYIGYHVPPRITVSILVWVFAIVLVGSLLVAAVAPEYGYQYYQGEYVWKGLQDNKNALGFTATTGALFFAMRAYSADIRKPWVYWLLSLSAIATLVMSRSATSLIGLLVGAMVVLSFFGARMLRFRGWITTLPLVFIAVGAIAILSMIDLGELTRTMGRSTTFMGRIDIWKMAWVMVEEKPWTGFGYGSLWLPKPGDEEIQAALLHISRGWIPSHAHNEFLQLASELGLPIAIVATLFFIQIFIEPFVLYSRYPSPLVLFVIALQCALFVGAFVEARLFLGRSLPWILFVALPVLLLRSTERLDVTQYKKFQKNRVFTYLIPFK